MGSIYANDTSLYYERRGSGPSLVFVSGATGDAGHWAAVADILADDYTVITYDRRGNSRSPRPPGWTSTTVDEQADDTAALIEGLGLAPAIAAELNDRPRQCLGDKTPRQLMSPWYRAAVTD